MLSDNVIREELIRNLLDVVELKESCPHVLGFQVQQRCPIVKIRELSGQVSTETGNCRQVACRRSRVAACIPVSSIPGRNAHGLKSPATEKFRPLQLGILMARWGGFEPPTP